ncbi:hypothetical protein niasHS_000646 [Heterodera schachtii]|uniref:Pinin/SDK/MemA protein domain-containing protein n=2 Tax=Heterodera TaxID=34509 RepID=A0ABD2K4U5_HETSC
MAVDVNSALTKAYDELRSIDVNISMLSGVSERFNRKRSAPTNDSFSTPFDRRVQDGGRKIIIGPESSDRNAKRGRYAADEGPPGDYSPPSSARTHRTLQSSVVMPTIETKSRTAVINEMKKNENKEDQVRNRRLFGNLLVATLRKFQNEEKTVGSKGQVQIDKQREVERRLEETDKENRNRMMREREALMAKKREKEMEIQSLRRQKAIEQSAEEKTKHFRRLQCFIQTQTKPPLFFLPSKHTLRTLELLKESSKKIETLIELRRDEMTRELRRLDTYTAASFGGTIGQGKNNVADESDDQDEEEMNVRGGLKSAIVVKMEGMAGETVAEAEEEKRDDEEGEKEIGQKDGEGEG